MSCMSLLLDMIIHGTCSSFLIQYCQTALYCCTNVVVSSRKLGGAITSREVFCSPWRHILQPSWMTSHLVRHLEWHPVGHLGMSSRPVGHVGWRHSASLFAGMRSPFVLKKSRAFFFFFSCPRFMWVKNALLDLSLLFSDAYCFWNACGVALIASSLPPQWLLAPPHPLLSLMWGTT